MTVIKIILLGFLLLGIAVALGFLFPVLDRFKDEYAGLRQCRSGEAGHDLYVKGVLLHGSIGLVLAAIAVGLAFLWPQIVEM